MFCCQEDEEQEPRGCSGVSVGGRSGDAAVKSGETAEKRRKEDRGGPGVVSERFGDW